MRPLSSPRPALPPRPALGGTGAERLLLRDGTAATVRRAGPDDRDAVDRFFKALSPESRRKRFLGAGDASPALIDRLCGADDPRTALTLLAWRQQDGRPTVIGVASYAAVDTSAAEAAFAVDDRLHGRGIATALLDRLAAIAAEHGFRWFEASTLTENHAMIAVFRDSGLELHSKADHGVLDVRIDIHPSADGVAAIDERQRRATVASLEPMLRPRSVAVIGVSRSPGNLGRRVFDAIAGGGFHGAFYAVNPAAAEVSGHTCYPSIGEAPGPIDLAIIAVPADAVAGVVDACATAGVRGLVVVSAGFAEVGEAGHARQRALVEQVRGYGLRMIGPNGMGVLNASADVRLNASFAERLPPPGGIALASQSGGVGLAILQLAVERRIGVSTFVSLGNKADVSGNDLLQYGESDDQTSVILLYLESFGNPRRFAQLARRIGRRKPIVAVKSGRTEAGSRAAGSHTAGLASSETAVEALFHQSGVIRADTIDEMLDVAACLELQPLPPGPKIAIVTNAGGPAIMAADACVTAGLTVPALSEGLRATLAAGLASAASTGNPVDLVASASEAAYRRTIEALLASPEVDALLVVYMPIDPSQSETVMAGIGAGVAASRSAGGLGKPVVACLMLQSRQPQPIPAGPEAVPAYAFPENAVRALGKAAAYARWRSEPAGLYWSFDDVQADEARVLCQAVAASRGDTWLTGEELGRVLRAFGLPLLAGTIARSEDDAVSLASIMGYPVVAKVNSPAILHKTERGGVRVNLRTPEDVRAAYREMAGLLPSGPRPDQMEGVLVQPMLQGIETIVGVADDPVFGPLVAFGLGGIEVELLRDVAFRIAPLTDRDADDLIHSVRSAPLLAGYRGRPAADVEALREVLLRVSLIAQHVPEIVEMDLNPVIALPAGQGCSIVDARIRVRPRE